MTLYHFGNCIALIYAPYYMTYKYAGLSEYGAFWKCFQAGGIYIFTQCLKMLVLATFFDSLSGSSLLYLSDILKAVVDVADLFGMALILSRIPGKDHNKLITTGFGWAISEVVVTRLLTLWIGARGAEFSWIYIQKCLESNILLVQHISSATLVWIFTRNNMNKAVKPLVIFLLAATILKPLWLDSTLTTLNLGPWSTLASKALCTIFNGLLTLNVYSKVNV